ncbi:MAG TPA: SDR family NAD(P)-dependent oxidoreductase [Thermodesulfobacteriota bacterium]|nr:SDR family NAD(P)-dependent oxidoreductase [Thermodesulfobacteriota bacterium]
MRLKGKIGVVTGGGAGIGRGIVLAFAREGADVAVLDINLEAAAKTAKDAEASGVRALPLELDVAAGEAVEKAVKRVLERSGKIDILVNNAGISPKRQGMKVPVVEMDPAEWDRVIAVNLRGTFLCSRAVLPSMMERKYGKIVNMSSVAGKTGGFAGGAHYASSKAAILALTKAIAHEAAPYGINVNAVMPSRIKSDMGFSIPESKLKERLAQIPLGRLGTPEDVAEAVLFLACDQTSSWITGATLNVSGGALMD